MWQVNEAEADRSTAAAEIAAADARHLPDEK